MFTVKLPKKINVAGFTYRIIANQQSDEALDAKLAWGDSSSISQMIRIQTQGAEQQRSSTFLHEILHIIDEKYGGNCLSEKDIDRLSHGLHQVMEQLGVRFIKV